MCFKLHEILKYGRYVGNIFYYDSSFYIGVIRKQNGILGKTEEIPLNCLKKLGSVVKFLGQSGYLKHTTFYFWP